MPARLWGIAFTPTVILPGGMPSIVKVHDGCDNRLQEVEWRCGNSRVPGEKLALAVAFCRWAPAVTVLESILFCFLHSPSSSDSIHHRYHA